MDVDRAVNQCILIPKSASASFLESRINAIIGLKHILALVAPLRSHLSKANNPLMRSLALTVDKVIVVSIFNKYYVTPLRTSEIELNAIFRKFQQAPAVSIEF